MGKYSYIIVMRGVRVKVCSINYPPGMRKQLLHYLLDDFSLT